MEYAESLAAPHAPISAVMAAHVNSCEECRAEIDSMRLTLESVQVAGEIAPSGEAMAELILAAKNVRRRSQARERWVAPMARHGKRVAAAAAVLFVVGGLAFMAQLEPEAVPVAEEVAPVAVPVVEGPVVLAVERVKPASVEEERLSEAVFARQAAPTNGWEKAQRRAVSQYEQEIAAALDALKRNPACVRAATLVNENRDRKTEVLRSLYVNMEKTL